VFRFTSKVAPSYCEGQTHRDTDERKLQQSVIPLRKKYAVTISFSR